MGSKTLLLFFISLAIVLAITSQVAARELAEASTSVDINSETLDYRTGGGGGGPGGEPKGPVRNPGGGWHGDGGYGGGGGGRYGQAVDAEP